MYNNNQTDSSETTQPKSKQSLLTLVLVLLVIIGAAIGYLFIMSNDSNSTPDDQSTEQTESGFTQKFQTGGQLMESGDVSGAAIVFKEMLDEAETVTQEGIAKLNLAITRLQTGDKEEAIAMLKEVSINEEYVPVTRAKAANYILNEYTSTKNADFAKENIFTGPVWGDFLSLDESDLEKAVINGFEYFVEVYPTPEAKNRLAAEYSFLIWRDGVTQAEKDEYAEKALEYIDFSDGAIEAMEEGGRIRYGDMHFSEVATAYNRKGMALDVLYFNGYIEDPQRVENAFQDGLNVILDNGESPGTELYLRYHYADFLVRLDAEGRADSIQKILVPMTQMEPNSAIAGFFRNWIGIEITYRENDLRLALPRNITRLAEISPEFQTALYQIGVSEGMLQGTSQ